MAYRHASAASRSAAPCGWRAQVRLTDQANGNVIADVVMAVPEGGPTDNSAMGTPTLAQRGLYEVYAKWSASDNRPAAAQYFVLHVGGETEILVNQKLNGGQWNLLGTFDLEPGQAHVVLTDQAVGGGYVIADAICFVEVAARPPPPNPLAHGLYFIDSDHLGTPRLVTDAANNVVWRDLPTTEPFGNSAPEENPSGAGSFVMPLAFPGQYRDNETALNYNYFRGYSPLGGRSVQSDPIGLAGGINTYTYVGGNPVSFVDPLGLQAYTGQTPPANIQGGPWEPQAGQPPGTFQGPQNPGGGPRDICRYVPDRANGGPANAPDAYWKTKTPEGKWQRYNLQGSPVTAEQAHPGTRPAAPAAAPATNWLLRLGVGIGLMLYSGEAH